jgi:hypothetical protein
MASPSAIRARSSIEKEVGNKLRRHKFHSKFCFGLQISQKYFVKVQSIKVNILNLQSTITVF